jgi:hypothetical protein
MPSIKIQLAYNKETPGTHVFKADDPAAPVTALYIRKSAFSDVVPKTVVLTVADD